MKNSNIEMHKKICEKLQKIYDKKNNDYGDSVHLTYQKYGMVSFLTRIEDKINRINNLYVDKKKSEIKYESIEDSILDACNYLILAYIELELEKERTCINNASES